MDAPNAIGVGRMLKETHEGLIPLAAGLHTDGTIHIYVYEKDSGLRIGLDTDGIGLVIKVDESARKLM